MKKIKVLKSILCVISLAIVGTMVMSFNLAKKNESSLNCGAAKVNITPEAPMRMSGYAGRKDPFSGIHDSLFATALVFSDGSKKAAIVTADLIGLSNTFCSETMDLIEKETGIDKENILLSAVHNHGGPVTRVYGADDAPNEAKYASDLKLKIVHVVAQASKNLQPVLIGTGTGTCKMNINRRARFADGSIWLGRNPDGACDHDVSVVRIDDLANNPIAVFVNWPCHGTVDGETNTLITGDWPGATARFVGKALGNQVVISVTAGASANVNPIYGPNNKFEDIDAIGMLVGEQVVEVAKKIKTTSGGTIGAVKKTVVAKGKKSLNSRLPNQKLEPSDDVDINLSVLKVGGILFAGISGELFTEIGMQIKKGSQAKNTIVITHCNGSSGYLLIDEAYPQGGYEAMTSRTMPGTESLIRENVLTMIRSVK